LCTFRTLEVGNLEKSHESGVQTQQGQTQEQREKEGQRLLLQGEDYYIPFEKAMQYMEDSHTFKRVELRNLLPGVSTYTVSAYTISTSI
jgi:hypothetical protein